MYWLVAGLFLIGAGCGAAIRLMMFLVVLLCAAVIALAATVEHGLGTAVFNAVITVVVLQTGYVAGFVARATIRSRQVSGPATAGRGRPVAPSIGQKRR